MKVMGIIFSFVIGVALLSGLGFAGNYLDWWQFNFFAPKYEQTRYNTFKESQAFNESKLHDAYEFKRQYLEASTPDQKQAIKDYARHTLETYDRNRLPPDLQSFYDTIMN